jgi:hypothetical protein
MTYMHIIFYEILTLKKKLEINLWNPWELASFKQIPNNYKWIFDLKIHPCLIYG